MRKTLPVPGYLLLAAGLALGLAACATKNTTVVPDTQPGDQLLDTYMLGDWCTNREETANANRAAGLSGLINVSVLFWRFKQDGSWDVSTSGFLYETHGNWSLGGLDTLQLSRPGTTPKKYQAQFKGDGANLHLEDDEGQFLVLSHCD